MQPHAILEFANIPYRQWSDLGYPDAVVVLCKKISMREPRWFPPTRIRRRKINRLRAASGGSVVAILEGSTLPSKEILNAYSWALLRANEKAKIHKDFLPTLNGAKVSRAKIESLRASWKKEFAHLMKQEIANSAEIYVKTRQNPRRGSRGNDRGSESVSDGGVSGGNVNSTYYLNGGCVDSSHVTPLDLSWMKVDI